MRKPALLFLLSIFIGGCSRDHDITTYRISKETPATVAPVASAPHTGPIDWKIPKGWKEQPPSAMRYGSFQAFTNDGKSVDISVIPLGGPAGGDLANINRWRDQIGLAPLHENELPRNSRTENFSNHSMLWVDFENKGQRITAAIYKQGNKTWFFKMTGEDVAVKAVQPSFREFLRSLHFHDTP